MAKMSTPPKNYNFYKYLMQAQGLSGYSGMSAATTYLGKFDSDKETSAIKIQETTVNQAKEIILKILPTNIVPFIWGGPGLGKSSLVKSICEENDWQLIDLRLSLLNPVDLRGLPVVDRKAGLARWIPPEFLPNGHTKKRGILFLDELNLAPLSVQSAAYSLILDKRVGEYTFPPHWMIVAAGNRTTDRANVYKMSAPLANRFFHLTVIPDFDTWKQWALKQVRKEIINFLIIRPTLLFKMPTDSENAYPTPRSWKFLSDILTALDIDKGVTPNIEQAIKGTIGNSVGSEFIEFIKNTDLKKIAEKIENFLKTGKLTMPTKVSERYAVITAVLKQYVNKVKINPAQFKKFMEKLNAEEKETVKKYLEGKDAR